MSSGTTNRDVSVPNPALTNEQIHEFRQGILRHFREEGRDFPWRRTVDPWLILTSEVMLQQTRTETVAARWEAWTARYPDPASLAEAPLSEVLTLWKGLGYNRRALALRNAAEQISSRHCGAVPRDEADLLTLPGVGPYTARAVQAFSFGEPVVLIETNIRAVFLFTFFPGREKVPDRELEPYIAATLDRSDPRTWYYALMDYGAALKKREPNPGRRSAAYTRQSAFEGSHRQVRSSVLHVLAGRGVLTMEELEAAVADTLGRETDIRRAVEELDTEGFLASNGGTIGLR